MKKKTETVNKKKGKAKGFPHSFLSFWQSIGKEIKGITLAILKFFKSIFWGIVHFFPWLKKVLLNIGKAVKSEIPILKKDWEEYSDEHHWSYGDTKKWWKVKWKSWKRTFSTVDSSREKLHEMLFAGNTRVGQLFEKMLMVLIIISVFFCNAR